MSTTESARRAAVRVMEITATGDLHEFAEVVAPTAINHEAVNEPSAARALGPDAFHAAALWLRGAFADLSWEILQVVSEGDVVVVEALERGRHVGPFAVHGADGRIENVWAPTGKEFAVRQSHWFRVVDAMVVEHWADRDDLGQGRQLGWVPPTPLYLLRCARAKRAAIRRLRNA